MSVSKTITFVALAVVFFNLTKTIFNHYVDVYEEVTPSRFGTITSFERYTPKWEAPYVSLQIETEEGKILNYDRAKGSDYELGEKIQVHEYRRKFTGRQQYIFRQPDT